MIRDHDKLKTFLAGYRLNFPECESDERYNDAINDAIQLIDSFVIRENSGGRVRARNRNA